MKTAELVNALFFIAFLAFTGALKGIYAAWTVRETIPMSRIIVTQRTRYGLLAFSQLILLGCAAWLHTLGSIGDIVAGAEKWLEIGWFGWIVVAGLVLVVASPLVSLISMIRIYTRPALLAYKHSSDMYCTTESYRLGQTRLVKATVEVQGSYVQRVYYPA